VGPPLGPFSALARDRTQEKGVAAMNHSPPWLDQFRNSTITVSELLAEAALQPGQLSFEVDFNPGFRVKAPPHFRSLIVKGNPNDPLLRQVLALAVENQDVAGSSKDPLREEQFRSGTGITKKYNGRILILLTGACAIHCRYCFRRHYEYGDMVLTPGDVTKLCETLSADSSLAEVILSGGDPLSVSDNRLIGLLSKIGEIDHIQTVRLHTRLPTTIPQRITEELLEFFSKYNKRIVIVVHTNHPNEIDACAERALSELRAARVILLNQAVLLKGVNDDAATLISHCWRLAQCGVIPYYIHMLDAVTGAAHFAVADHLALEFQEKMRTELPGYLVPRFVREVPGAPYKVPLEVATMSASHAIAGS
jgi:EF-P beta-lysylation protein EpmB